MGYNILFLALLFCIAIAYSQPVLHCEQSAVPPSPNEWSGWGRDIENSRYNPLTAIDADTVSNLVLRCNFSSAAGITSQPSYSNGVLYFGDNQVTHSGASAGYVYAVRGSDCSLIWRSKLSSYTGVSTSNTRWTPLVYQGKVIVGDRTAGSGWVVALNVADGSLAWRTRVETHPWTILTGSASAACSTIFFGVSSMEETASKFPGFSGFSFRGSVVALNADDGSLLWKHYTMPDIAGYAGAAVWASSPSIDLTSRRVFVGTGNGYSLPPSVQNCSETALLNNQSVEPCFGSDAPDVQYDSILALNIDDGSVAWIAKKRDYDVWSVACIALPAGNPWCPKIKGPDFDFGQNPILYQGNNPGGKYLAIGQKSGLMFSVSANDGSSRWDTAAGVGGVIGGLLFGSTSDADNIFGQQGNSVYSYWTDSNTNTTYCGSYIVAYDKNTGAVKWQTPSV
ncbi:MAG TPA: PQQ-binding-like beta-propeller repeat protein, partial [Saprospiraceae bacterium]|nr:PQQ-binding-like beta-propeller repeat protein [Saprospiraceae bacterium]